jgi:hypothetical protein
MAMGATTNDSYERSKSFLAAQFETMNCVSSNYALERSVKACGWRAARVQRDFTLAARWNLFARPAQRGR